MNHPHKALTGQGIYRDLDRKPKTNLPQIGFVNSDLGLYRISRRKVYQFLTLPDVLAFLERFSARGMPAAAALGAGGVDHQTVGRGIDIGLAQLLRGLYQPVLLTLVLGLPGNEIRLGLGLIGPGLMLGTFNSHLSLLYIACKLLQLSLVSKLLQ